jgi:DUF4097 and DUF4098 domain-containing protein YvlB
MQAPLTVDPSRKPSALPSPTPLAVLLALALLPACDITIKDGDVSFNEARGRATQQFNRTYPLAPQGRVEVVNVNGDIELAPGAPGTVGVAAEMSARAMNEERAKAVLAESKIEEEASPEHIKLTTVRPGRGGGLQVNYRITVPPDARVELTTNNGSLKGGGVAGHVKGIVSNGGIDLTGLRGSVDLALVNGHIVVRMAEVNDRIRLEATNGRLSLEVPKSAKATLNARSVNGSITVTGLNTQEASGRRIRSLESQINGGGPELDVRVTNGRITIEGK